MAPPRPTGPFAAGDGSADHPHREPARFPSQRAGDQPVPLLQLSEGLATVRTVERHLDEILAAVPAAATPSNSPSSTRRACSAPRRSSASARCPAFDQAALDGYAARAEDVVGATLEAPVELAVIGESLAGRRHAVVHRSGPGAEGRRRRDAAGRRRRRRPGSLDRPGRGAGRRARRAAGGQLRPADRGRRRARRPRRPGRARRSAPRRSACWPPSAGSACWCGPRPRIAVLCAGTELVDVGTAPAPGQLVDVNSYALAAAARDAGAEAYRSGILPSDRRRLTEVLESQLLRSDLVLIAGTFASGGFDMVQEVLAELGRDALPAGHHAPRARRRASGGSAATRSRSSASRGSRWRRWWPSRCSSARRSG